GQGPATLAAGAEQGLGADDVRSRCLADPPRCVVPRRLGSDPQAPLLDRDDRSAGDRLQRRDAVAPGGAFGGLRGCTGLDAACDRSGEGVVRSTRDPIRRERVDGDRRPARDQGRHRISDVTAPSTSADSPLGPTDPISLIRSKQYRVLLVFAALVGVLVSVAAWGFLEAVHAGQTWVYTD